MEISVIIPVYNAEKYLKTCLDSLLKQSFKDFEVIAINDGSSDSSLDILKAYTNKFNKLTVLNQKHNNSSSARNLGLDNVKSRFVCFVDADDYVHRDYLQILYDALVNNNCEIAQCNIKSVENYDIEKDEINNLNVNVVDKMKFLRQFCSSTNSVDLTSLCNKLYKAELFDGLRFPEDKLFDDEHLVHILYYRSNNIAKVAAKLYFYYMSDNSLMRSKASLDLLDSVDAVEQQIKFFKDNNENKCVKLLQLKYFISLFWVLNQIKKNFPNEIDIIASLENKTKGWKKALLIKGTKFSDKVYLIKIAFNS